jgi:hypothetical protein
MPPSAHGNSRRLRARRAAVPALAPCYGPARAGATVRRMPGETTHPCPCAPQVAPLTRMSGVWTALTQPSATSPALVTPAAPGRQQCARFALPPLPAAALPCCFATLCQTLLPARRPRQQCSPPKRACTCAPASPDRQPPPSLGSHSLASGSPPPLSLPPPPAAPICTCTTRSKSSSYWLGSMFQAGKTDKSILGNAYGGPRAGGAVGRGE